MNDTPTLIDKSAELLLSKVTAEYLNRVERGERPNVDDYFKRYPKIANALRQMLPALKSSNATPGTIYELGKLAPADPSSVLGQLGDYRIIREAGKGGMGVVYEAWQISLDRRVALKVLPFVSALDPRGLQRFKNEAHAAAMLHHQGIVPVYSVGCERGVHYFAMQFIDGRTLADMLNDLRSQEALGNKVNSSSAEMMEFYDRTTRAAEGTPLELVKPKSAGKKADTKTDLLIDSVAGSKGPGVTSTRSSRADQQFFRSIVQLAVQATEALEHAHSHGVIHRDIKPANMLVDESQHLWITDFGVAQIGNNSGLTLTGDLLGTLRYMSPEQALGKRVVIDQRTDIYSLGATLYELLTMQPVFDGRNQQETLRQIAFDEPRPLRRINPTIPIDLETIVLKTLAKNPDERYSTAQELADDLHRYLRHEPIRARRSTLADRSRKWVRRHPAWVAATGLVLCLAVVVLGISNILVAMERNAKDEALVKAKKAEENEAERRKEAERERQRAETNFRKVREAVDRVFTLAAEKMADQPHMEQIRRVLLEDALEFYQGFLKEKGEDASVRYEAARAYWRVGTICGLLARNDQAEKALKDGSALFAKLTAEYPEVREYNDDLLECQSELALVYQQMHTRTPDHIATRLEVLAIAEKRVVDWPAIPAYARRLAKCHVDVANAYLELRPDLSEEHCRRALELHDKMRIDFPNEPEDLMGVSFTRHWYGRALNAQRKFVAAEAEYRLSVQIREQLLAKEPLNPGYQHQLAHVQSNLSSTLIEMDQLPEAEGLIRSAIRHAERLTEDFPNMPEHRRKFCDYLDDLANVQVAQGHDHDAITSLRKVLENRVRLINEYPHLLLVGSNLGWIHYKLGLLLLETGNPTEANDCFRQALTSFEEALKKKPDGPPELNRLANFLSDCPAVQFRDAERAVKLASKSLQINSESPQSWSILGYAQYRRGRWADAVESLRKSLEMRPNNAAIEELCLGMAYWQLDEKKRAKQSLDKTRDFVANQTRHDYRLRRYLREAETLMGEKKVD